MGSLIPDSDKQSIANAFNDIHDTFARDIKFIKDAKKVINVWDLSHEIYHYMYNKPSNWRPKENTFKHVDHIICSSKIFSHP